MREKELQGHLKGYHNISSLILKPNQSNAETQIEPDDRCFIYGQKRRLCDDEPETAAVAESFSEDKSPPEESVIESEPSSEQERSSCSRFRCSGCSFVHYNYSRVSGHIAKKHRISKLSRRKKDAEPVEAVRQEMFVKLESLHLPANIKCPSGGESFSLWSDSKENQEPTDPSRTARRRGRPRKTETREQTMRKITRKTRSSPLADSVVKRRRGRSSVDVSCRDVEEAPPQISVIEEHTESVETDEDIVNVLYQLIQEVEEDAVITVDSEEERCEPDNTLEELDCIILEPVSPGHRPTPLSNTEQEELKFILESSSSVGCEEPRPLSPLSPSPGPSRPYQCPRCPAKFDTAVEVVNHVAVCPDKVRVSDDDTSSLSTGVSVTAIVPAAVISSPARNIKTDKVSDIKSSVTNVYIRFVQVAST